MKNYIELELMFRQINLFMIWDWLTGIMQLQCLFISNFTLFFISPTYNLFYDPKDRQGKWRKWMHQLCHDGASDRGLLSIRYMIHQYTFWKVVIDSACCDVGLHLFNMLFMCKLRWSDDRECTVFVWHYLHSYDEDVLQGRERSSPTSHRNSQLFEVFCSAPLCNALSFVYLRQSSLW